MVAPPPSSARRLTVAVYVAAYLIPHCWVPLPFIDEYGTWCPGDPLRVRGEELPLLVVVQGEHGGGPALRGRGLADRFRAFDSDRRKSGQ